jgi:uncharacterized membrane protein YfcA
MLTSIVLILLGMTAGTLSGLVGIGGRLIIIPALIYFFKLTPHQAQGTTLTLMVPPIEFSPRLIMERRFTATSLNRY